MNHKLSRIIAKPDDYRVCPKCRTINWYENGECVSVSCEETALQPVPITEIKSLKKTLQECGDIQITV